MSNKSTILKKTFRFNPAQQKALEELQRLFCYATESATITHVLENFIRLDAEVRKLEKELTQAEANLRYSRMVVRDYKAIREKLLTLPESIAEEE